MQPHTHTHAHTHDRVHLIGDVIDITFSYSLKQITIYRLFWGVRLCAKPPHTDELLQRARFQSNSVSPVAHNCDVRARENTRAPANNLLTDISTCVCARRPVYVQCAAEFQLIMCDAAAGICICCILCVCVCVCVLSAQQFMRSIMMGGQTSRVANDARPRGREHTYTRRTTHRTADAADGAPSTPVPGCPSQRPFGTIDDGR